jgi:hypothetical protein
VRPYPTEGNQLEASANVLPDIDQGSIIFGGYDTDKFEGELAVFDIQPAEQDQISRNLIIWSSIGVTDKSGSVVIPTQSTPQSVLLDSGTALTIVPQDIFTSLATYFGAVYSKSIGTWVVNCDLGYGTVDFGFGGPSGAIISVPFQELAVFITDNQGNIYTYNDGTPACQLGFDVADSQSGVILGDTFLRSAYVVYDIDRSQIGIAQTKFNVSSSNIKPISTGTDNLLGASSVFASGTTISYLATGGITQQQNPAGGAATRTGKAGGSSLAPTAASGTIVGGIPTTYAQRATDIPGAVAPTGSSGSGSSGSAKKSSAELIHGRFGLEMCSLLVATLMVAVSFAL